jgi:hypothetical protein
VDRDIWHSSTVSLQKHIEKYNLFDCVPCMVGPQWTPQSSTVDGCDNLIGDFGDTVCLLLHITFLKDPCNKVCSDVSRLDTHRQGALVIAHKTGSCKSTAPLTNDICPAPHAKLPMSS